KLANNFVVGCAIEAMSESFALVRKYGVPPEVFYGVLTDGLFACGAYKAYGKIIAEERYFPAGHRGVMGLKDAGLIFAAAEAVGVPLPSGNVWRDRLLGAIAHGEGEHDWAVMARDQARASGLETNCTATSRYRVARRARRGGCRHRAGDPLRSPKNYPEERRQRRSRRSLQPAGAS